MSFIHILLLIILFYLPFIFLKFGLRKKITHPPTLFCATFSFVLSMAYIAHITLGFYEISYESYAIYGLGNLSFIAGGMITDALNRRNIKNSTQLVINKQAITLLKILIFTLLLYFPIAYSEFKHATPDMPLALKILRIRERGLEEQVYSTITNNMIILSSCLVMYMTFIFSIKKINVYYYSLTFVLFCAYNFMTGTRAAIILISIACIFIYLLNTNKNNKTSKLFLLSVGMTAIILGALVAIFMGKDGMERDESLLANLNKVVDNYFSYTVQGVILFDNYVIGREKITPNWDILSGSAEVINKITSSNIFKTDSKFSEFSHFAKDKDGNVYTIYFAIYPLYGLVGVILFFMLYGTVCTILYNHGPGIVSVLVGYINATLCLNIFNEQVFINIIFTIKFICFLLLIRCFERIK
ncbi:O139 family O-antigen polymerase [Escherichia coli]|uniref:O139 family O-antigen polymerase n=1 Tax=Escherichia coli TaxID=562 RepID=UPI000BE3879E|nr:O139 family O-antigen polymerase [Escherichia coli]EFI6539763.1 O139 family O-antigen polymerase [Escherichia coli]EFN3302017.1 O139 family O-antigen polymerase [Escherichia coli]HAG5876929.1 O139 family O-antigen polymerase [Escherichia coli]